MARLLCPVKVSREHSTTNVSGIDVPTNVPTNTTNTRMTRETSVNAACTNRCRLMNVSSSYGSRIINNPSLLL